MVFSNRNLLFQGWNIFRGQAVSFRESSSIWSFTVSIWMLRSPNGNHHAKLPIPSCAPHGVAAVEYDWNFSKLPGLGTWKDSTLKKEKDICINLIIQKIHIVLVEVVFHWCACWPILFCFNCIRINLFGGHFRKTLPLPKNHSADT